MTLRQTQRLATELMEKHGLIEIGWRFSYDNARSRAGVCNYTSREIGLSKYLVPHMNDDAIMDTILHEIAHALVGSRHGHDRVWQRKAMEIGCNGKRCYNPRTEMKNFEETLAVQSKYTLTCPSCGRKSPIHRKPKRSKACGKCCNGTYQEKYKMRMTQNY